MLFQESRDKLLKTKHGQQRRHYISSTMKFSSPEKKIKTYNLSLLLIYSVFFSLCCFFWWPLKKIVFLRSKKFIMMLHQAVWTVTPWV